MQLTNNDVQVFANKIKQELNLHSFALWLTSRNEIKLAMLAVPKDKMKQGIGSQAMQKLINFADQYGKRIILTTGVKDSNFGTTSSSRLKNFYKRFGFVENKGRNKDFTFTENMFRNPVIKRQIIEFSKKLSFKQFLAEAPINDYETIGDFSKNSSFRHAQDRRLITNPKSIERVRKKFGNTPYDFNFYFVNSSKANRHTEVGLVKPEWLKTNLGDEVYNAVSKNFDNDSINVVFTNNKGSERMPMTAWVMAHRLGHALARESDMRSSHNQYRQASNFLISNFSDIMELYNKSGLSNNQRSINANRADQLTMLHFFQQVCTFKSARDNNIRDWFEVLNELIAQYLTTGKIKFNNAPRCFGTKIKYCTAEVDEVNQALNTLARDMQFMIDDVLSSAQNSILVM